MALLEVPLAPGGAEGFEVETQLDGVGYRLLFRWNARESFWYLTIKDLDNVVIKPSVKLVNQWAMLRKYVSNTDLPAGQLVIVDQGGDSPPGLAELGDSHLLLYFDEAEMAAL